MAEQSAVGDERREDPTKLSNGDILQAVIAPLARLWRRSTSAAVDLKPESAELHYRDGVLKVRSGDMDGALADFDKALARAPGFADAVLARAELLDGQGRCEAARGEYERARQLWSEMPAGAPDRRGQCPAGVPDLEAMSGRRAGPGSNVRQACRTYEARRD